MIVSSVEKQLHSSAYFTPQAKKWRFIRLIRLGLCPSTRPGRGEDRVADRGFGFQHFSALSYEAYDFSMRGGRACSEETKGEGE